MKNEIELIALIYKSVDYLKMIVEQLTSQNNQVQGWDVTYRVIANDASSEVLDYLQKNDINYSVYNDPRPNDFYLNRVYRCWNYGAETSESSNICFVNSDMVFSKDWLANLLKHHDGTNIPCSRLVESGKMTSGTHGVSKYFGNHPRNISYSDWENWVSESSRDQVFSGGLYMPCVFETERFVSSGGYPEGNVFYENGRLVAGYPNDRPVMLSGDAFCFVNLEKKYGMRHITVFDSLVYHIQEGEKDE